MERRRIQTSVKPEDREYKNIHQRRPILKLYRFTSLSNRLKVNLKHFKLWGRSTLCDEQNHTRVHGFWHCFYSVFSCSCFSLLLFLITSLYHHYNNNEKKYFLLTYHLLIIKAVKMIGKSTEYLRQLSMYKLSVRSHTLAIKHLYTKQLTKLKQMIWLLFHF